MLKSIKIVRLTFALALTIFEILTFPIFDLEKLGQDHKVLLFLGCHLMPVIFFYTDICIVQSISRLVLILYCFHAVSTLVQITLLRVV